MRTTGIPRLAILFAAASCCAVGLATASGKLWIVANTGCPGAHFATIQDGIDAASDGDVILVRPGPLGQVYAPFDLDGKSLALVSDGRGLVTIGGPATLRPSRILNLAPGQYAVAQGFTFLGKLELSNNAGPVWIEDCFLETVSVDSSLSAIIARCDIVPPFSHNAVSLSASQLHLHDCTLQGGEGGAGAVVGYTLFPGRDGGSGLVAESGVVFSSGCSLTGGAGGPGGYGSTGLWSAGGNGGHGLSLMGGARAYLLDTALTGGPGGIGIPGGEPGQPSSGAGVAVELPGRTRSFETTSPVLEGQPFSMLFTGEPGDVCQLFVSGAQQHLLLPQLNGTVGPRLPGAAAVAGVVPWSGALRQNLVMPADLVQPGEAAVIYGQGLFVSAQGRGFLGATAAWVVLDESHDPFDGCAHVIYVDDDAPGDPGPGNPAVSNPLENGTAALPFDAIQEGIDAARLTGTTVLVRDGLYSGIGNENIALNRRGVTVKSENGPSTCTISVSTPQTPAFVYDTRQVLPTRVEGFEVTGGAPGFEIQGGQGITVRDCRVVGNERGFRINLRAQVDIESCIIMQNTTQGRGAGIDCEAGLATIRNCLIAENSSGQIPGGMFVGYLSQATIRGCTFARNTSPRAGALYASDSAVDVSGSIFWGNGAEEILLANRSVLDMSYSDVMNGISGVTVGTGTGTVSWGPGNIDSDPKFVNPALGDYHLTAGSPCIDAGDPSYVPLIGETDIDRQARRVGAAVDMGADER